MQITTSFSRCHWPLSPWAVAAALLVLGTATALAETIRLPCRYVVTTYRLHHYTGRPGHKRVKEKLLRSPLDVELQKEGKQRLLILTARPRSQKDTSGKEVVTLTPAEVEHLSAALEKAEAVARKAYRQNQSGNHVLWSGERAGVTILFRERRRQWHAELAIGEFEFVLNPREVKRFLQVLQRTFAQ